MEMRSANLSDYYELTNITHSFSDAENDAQCVKSAAIWSFPSLYFPTFGLKTKRYSIFLYIQSKCGKIRNRKTVNTDNFTQWHLMMMQSTAINPRRQKYENMLFLIMIHRNMYLKTLKKYKFFQRPQ